MKNIVWKFGLLSGVLSGGLMALFVPLALRGTIDFDRAEVLGYTSMLVAFLAVFFGIRSYRDHVGGTITFGQAFKVGILITLISCAMYVLAWEIYYYGFDPGFEEKYTEFMIGKMKAEGESAAAIAKVEQQMADFKRLYKNPVFNVGITFMEIFPVGLIVTLISAGILRRTPQMVASS